MGGGWRTPLPLPTTHSTSFGELCVLSIIYSCVVIDCGYGQVVSNNNIGNLSPMAPSVSDLVLSGFRIVDAAEIDLAKASGKRRQIGEFSEEHPPAQVRKGACRHVLGHSEIRKAVKSRAGQKQHQFNLKATHATHRAAELTELLARNSPVAKYWRGYANSHRQYVVRTREIQPVRYDGIGSKCRRAAQYIGEELPWIVAIGTAPSAGGCRAPLARIITHVTKYHIERASVELADLYSACFSFRMEPQRLYL